MRRTLLGWMTVALLAAAASAGTTATAGADTIRVMSTTDTVDAGLVDGYGGIPGLKALFTQWEAANGLPSDTLNYTGVGTGAALNNARGGQADVVITHAPSLEAQFVSQGYSLEPYGRAIFYSDYVVLGPQDDPAGVLSAAPHDAAAAFERIAAAGDGGDAVFASRADNSGTNVQEQVIWGLTSGVAKQAATNGGGDATRAEPGSGGTWPSWYLRTNKGQAANVQQCATTAKCYTMTDRGTYNKLVNTGVITQLKVTAEKNAAGARGGQNLLVNPFSAYIVNPSASFPGGSPTPNVAAATRFVDFLTSQAFQDWVPTFPSVSDPAFRPDAFPAVTRDIPPIAAGGGPGGATTTLALTFTDQLPGGGAVDGLPVQLQASTDGGRTYADAGPPVATDADGRVTFRPALTQTTAFRAVLPRYRKFSPFTTNVGIVAVTPASTQPPPPAKATDKTAPTISKAKLSAKRLSFSITEAGTVKATIKLRKTRRVDGRTRTTYVTVKRLTIATGKAGTTSRTFRALKAGTYHVTFAATDRAGNTRTRTVTLVIKATKKKSRSR